MNIKTKLALVLSVPIGLIALQASGADAPLTAVTQAADAATQPAVDHVVAAGKGLEVRQSEIDEVLRNYKASSGTPDEPLPAGAETQVLNQLIDIKLNILKATDADKAEGKKQGDLSFENIKKVFGTSKALQKQLKAASMTEEELHEQVVREATAKASLVHALGITVTEPEIKEFFESRGPGAYDLPQRAHARDIFLWVTKPYSSEPLPPETVQKKRQLIHDLLKRARAGEDFAALARQYSEDAESKDKGGELEPFSQQRDAIGGPAFALKPNEISDVIETPDGFYIVQLLDMVPPKKMEVADMADRIRDFLINKRTRDLAPAYIEKTRAEFGVEVIDQRLKAAIAAEKAQEEADAKAQAAAEAAAATQPVVDATTEPSTAPSTTQP